MQTHFFNSKTFQYLTKEELIQQEKQIQLLEEIKELLAKPQTKRK